MSGTKIHLNFKRLKDYFVENLDSKCLLTL